jgi:hypothetical protein
LYVKANVKEKLPVRVLLYKKKKKNVDYSLGVILNPRTERNRKSLVG